jgi:hypothetical protein
LRTASTSAPSWKASRPYDYTTISVLSQSGENWKIRKSNPKQKIVRNKWKYLCVSQVGTHVLLDVGVLVVVDAHEGVARHARQVLDQGGLAGLVLQ